MAKKRKKPARTPPAAGPATATAQPKIKYAWRRGSSVRANAQAVGEELEALEVLPGQYHKVDTVLEAARDPASAMHSHFTWNNGQAADKHRRNEARELLRSITHVIVRDEEVYSRPVYVHIRDTQSGPSYIRAEVVASDGELKRQAILEAVKLLSGIRRRYEWITELSPLWEQIHRAAMDAQRDGSS